MATLVKGSSRSSSLPIWIYYRPAIKKGKVGAIVEKWRHIFSRRRRKEATEAAILCQDVNRCINHLNENESLIQLFTFTEHSPLLYLIRVLYDRRLVASIERIKENVTSLQQRNFFFMNLNDVNYDETDGTHRPRSESNAETGNTCPQPS